MKALCVFSGGLDSMLASETIRAQGIEVQGLFFETPFFSAAKARESARSIELPLRVIDITEKHLVILKKPKHGFGGNMNPCIDCHALMFRTAGDLLKSEKADFIITGEVLGQRPMSQNKNALSMIESEVGMRGLILRPLSAKNLQITLPEKYRWVDRNKLLDFSGRSRKPQIDLAKRLNIHAYPTPAGGCLLTDRIFSRRLRDLMLSNALLNRRNIELLKLGRHFRIGTETKIIVGRNMDENDSIRLLADEDDTMLTALSVPGPTVMVDGDITLEIKKLAAVMTLSYSDAEQGMTEEVNIQRGGRSDVWKVVTGNKEEFAKYMI